MWKARNPRWLLVGAAVLFILAQFIPVETANPPEDPSLTIEANTTMPDAIRDTLSRACTDCHSYRTVLPWYGHVAPVSWFLADHRRHARKHVNLSEWARMKPKDADHALDEMCEEVEEGGMPLASYRWMHDEANLTGEERDAFCDWTGQERGRIRATMTDSGAGSGDDDRDDDDADSDHDDGRTHTD